MTTRHWFPLALVATLTGGVSLTARQAPAPVTPTYTKDVAPILFKNCTSCHRPGEIAPMSLMTYDDVRPRAKDIRDEVSDGNMPPWHASAPHGTFLNERWLSEEDKRTLMMWANGGAPKGNPKDMPPTPVYTDGWTIGKPDVVFEMPEAYKVPAEGVIEYEYFYIPTNFTEPKWIQAIEIRPGNREVVHHALAFYKATNISDRPVTGTAVFNVTPESAGVHFNKIECFCFTEQRLDPGQSVDMAVSFYVDPAFAEDEDTTQLSELTLSYTFYPSDKPQGGEAEKLGQAPAGSAGGG